MAGPSYASPGGTVTRLPCGYPWNSAAARSTPSPRASRSRHSFISNVPISMLRTLYTAKQCHGSHGSGVACSNVYSTGSVRVLARKAFTPSV